MELDLQRNIENPLYLRLSSELRRQVQSGSLRPGDRLPSFAQLRSRYGIHKNTVERAHLLLEQEGLVIREQGRGTFVAKPRQVSAAKSAGAKGVIGFCGIGFMLSSPSPYWSRLLEGVHEVVSQNSMQLLLVDPETPDLQEKVDGILLNGMWSQPHSQWHDERWPCVSLLLPSRTSEVSSVVADDYAGAREATQHLLDLGHHRIAYLYNAADQNLSPRRSAGYRDALRAAGVEFNRDWVRKMPGEPVVGFTAIGRDNMRRWLQEDWRSLGCTALLAHNDEVAMGAIEALNEEGLRVPEDVSVVGFDGTELVEYARPKLTSVEVPLREIGKTGMELLLHQIDNGVDEFEHITMPTLVRVRESSVAPVEF